MAGPRAHLIAGALAGIAPDCLLVLFGWRQTWLPQSHVLVRWHRYLHGRDGVLLSVLLGYLSHLLVDACTPHRRGPI